MARSPKESYEISDSEKREVEHVYQGAFAQFANLGWFTGCDYLMSEGIVL